MPKLTNDIVVRSPVNEDLTEINALILAAKGSWGYAPELIDLWRPILQVTESCLQQRVFWVAEDLATNKLVWLYSIKISDGAVDLSNSQQIIHELDDCWMSPEYIGLGLGANLFQHLVGYLQSENISGLRIVSDPNAEGFYLKMGARRVAEIASTPAGRVLPVLEYRVPAV